MDMAVCEPLDGDEMAAEQVMIYSLQDVEKMTCTVQTTPFVTIGGACDIILKRVDENGTR